MEVVGEVAGDDADGQEVFGGVGHEGFGVGAGESLKRPVSRLGWGSVGGLKWWSRARSAASWNFFDSSDS